MFYYKRQVLNAVSSQYSRVNSSRMANFCIILLALVASAAAASEYVYHKEGNHEVPCETATTNFTGCTIKPMPWIMAHDEAKKPWYYLMGNRAHAYLLNYILHSDDPEEGSDFSAACASIRRIKESNGRAIDGFKIDGFGQCAEYECNENHGERACQPILIPKPFRGDAIAKRGTTEATTIWTYEEKYALAVRCSGTTTVWSVRGVEPGNIPEDIMKKIFDVIEAFDHGKFNPKCNNKKFSRKNAVIYEQKDCKPRP